MLNAGRRGGDEKKMKKKNHLPTKKIILAPANRSGVIVSLSLHTSGCWDRHKEAKERKR